MQKILIKKIILYRTNILFLLSGVFFSQNYVFIIFVGRVLVGMGAEVGIFKWKVEFHGMEWNLMERFHVELIKTSQNSNGEIPQV